MAGNTAFQGVSLAYRATWESVCPKCGYRVSHDAFDNLGAHRRAKPEDRMPYEAPRPLIKSDPDKSRRPKEEKQELTLELLQELPYGWETAMVYPLPAKPSYELLEAARLNVLDFLDFHSQPIGHQTKEDIANALRAGVEKMIEIASLLNEDPRWKVPVELPDDDIPF